MTTETTRGHQRLRRLWLIGTLCRLSSLRFTSGCPYSLGSAGNDLYTALDPKTIFQSEEDMFQCLVEMVRSDRCMKGASTEEMEALGDLVLSFADCPETLVKIYLEDNEKNLL